MHTVWKKGKMYPVILHILHVLLFFSIRIHFVHPQTNRSDDFCKMQTGRKRQRETEEGQNRNWIEVEEIQFRQKNCPEKTKVFLCSLSWPQNSTERIKCTILACFPPSSSFTNFLRSLFSPSSVRLAGTFYLWVFLSGLSSKVIFTLIAG